MWLEVVYSWAAYCIKRVVSDRLIRFHLFCLLCFLCVRVKKVLISQAEAEKIRKIGEAEACSIEAVGKAEAEKMKLKAEAYQQYGEAAKTALVLEALPKVIHTNVLNDSFPAVYFYSSLITVKYRTLWIYSPIYKYMIWRTYFWFSLWCPLAALLQLDLQSSWVS